MKKPELKQMAVLFETAQGPRVWIGSRPFGEDEEKVEQELVAEARKMFGDAKIKETVTKTVELPGFSEIDKENMVRLFMDEVVEHRELANINFLSGKIDGPKNEWCQSHADYIEDLQNRLIELLNLCPTLPE